MDINPRKVKVSELTNGYTDKGEGGVRGFGGKLNIRPAFQREFVYRDDQRNAVIQTLRNGYPLNTMYWALVGNEFELMDGQQRTISICQYVNGEYSIDWDGSPRGFNNLTPDLKQQILDYELDIYVCQGTDSEKLEWFKIINIAGEELSPQELRNAIYTGPWLADAKRWFGKRLVTPAMQDGRDKLVVAKVDRQEVLERALDWFTNGKIEDYMQQHQHDSDATELWDYWQAVFSWVSTVFPNQDSARVRLMKGLPWGRFYNEHKDAALDGAKLEARIVQLIEDDEVEQKRGIYEYLLTGNEKTLSLRTFDEKTKQEVYAKQGGICPHCPPEKGSYQFHEMEADHEEPWCKGGKTVAENCQMLCRKHNREKSAN